MLTDRPDMGSSDRAKSAAALVLNGQREPRQLHAATTDRVQTYSLVNPAGRMLRAGLWSRRLGLRWRVSGWVGGTVEVTR